MPFLPQFFSILHLLDPFASHLSFSFLFLPFSFTFLPFLFLYNVFFLFFYFPPFSPPLFIFFPQITSADIFPSPQGGGEGVVSPGIEKQLYRFPQSQK
jgi:hypothetical protein